MTSTGGPEQRDKSVGEIARELDVFRDQYRDDKHELREEMRRGFSRVEAAVAQLRFVAPDVYRADQLRQDADRASLRETLTAMQVEAQNNRRLVLGSFLSPVVVGVFLYMLNAAG